MLIPDWLTRQAAARPGRLALIAPGAAWSFAELSARADAVVARLAALGVAPGDRVAVLARNCADYVALVHAAPRCGAVLVPLNTRLAAAELAFQVADSAVRLILCDEAHLGPAAHIPSPPLGTLSLSELNIDPSTFNIDPSTFDIHPSTFDIHPSTFDIHPSTFDIHPSTFDIDPSTFDIDPSTFDIDPSTFNIDPSTFDIHPSTFNIDPSTFDIDPSTFDIDPSTFDIHPSTFDLDSPHTIIYTSGTTGSPKGAMLSCGNHWWSATASALNLGLREDDRWLAVLPLFHVGGLSILLRGAIYGIPVVLHERFDPAAANAAIDTQGVTIISVVATMLQRMLDARGDQPYPPHFRCALLGGGPAPRPLLERCAALGVPVVQTYGLTESSSQAVTLSPEDALRKLGSAGQPLLPVGLRIDVDGREAAPGEVGEILLSGPTITAGYIGRPEASAEAIREGWLHTGDLGHRDAEGYLYVADRRSDLIISGGENIYPAEVEAALLAHPSVSEAGVVGLPDPQWGQVPVAAVVLRSPADPAEILAFVTGRLAAYKLPRRIVILGELPCTASGKLQRRLLREWLG